MARDLVKSTLDKSKSFDEFKKEIQKKSVQTKASAVP
jgi:hypothetical protein